MLCQKNSKEYFPPCRFFCVEFLDHVVECCSKNPLFQQCACKIHRLTNYNNVAIKKTFIMHKSNLKVPFQCKCPFNQKHIDTHIFVFLIKSFNFFSINGIHNVIKLTWCLTTLEQMAVMTRVINALGKENE